MRHAITTALWVLRMPIPARYKREEFQRVRRQWQMVRPHVVQRGHATVRYTPRSPSFASRDYALEALRRRAIGAAAFKVMWAMRQQEQAILHFTPSALKRAMASLLGTDMTRYRLRQAIADKTWPQPEELAPRRPSVIIDAEAVEIRLLPKPRGP